jgi:hypothetical protein
VGGCRRMTEAVEVPRRSMRRIEGFLGREMAKTLFELLRQRRKGSSCC